MPAGVDRWVDGIYRRIARGFGFPPTRRRYRGHAEPDSSHNVSGLLWPLTNVETIDSIGTDKNRHVVHHLPTARPLE